MATDADVLANVRAQRRKLIEVRATLERTVGDFDRVSLPTTDGDVLRDLLAADKAHTVIEIGLAYGSSALAISEALVSQGSENSKHVIIDAYQAAFHNAGWSAITDVGLTDVCSLISERSQIALPRLMTNGFIADAAFVDGSHIFHNVFVDLFFLRELVRPGGLVVLDDCDWPSVATAVRYFEFNARWRPVATKELTRLRAYRLPDPQFEPGFEDFKPFA
jgi:predicted O-methyltransferase YrrM